LYKNCQPILGLDIIYLVTNDGLLNTLLRRIASIAVYTLLGVRLS